MSEVIESKSGVGNFRYGVTYSFISNSDALASINPTFASATFYLQGKGFSKIGDYDVIDINGNRIGSATISSGGRDRYRCAIRIPGRIIDFVYTYSNLKQRSFEVRIQRPNFK